MVLSVVFLCDGRYFRLLQLRIIAVSIQAVVAVQCPAVQVWIGFYYLYHLCQVIAAGPFVLVVLASVAVAYAVCPQTNEQLYIIVLFIL